MNLAVVEQTPPCAATWLMPRPALRPLGVSWTYPLWSSLLTRLYSRCLEGPPLIFPAPSTAAPSISTESGQQHRQGDMGAGDAVTNSTLSAPANPHLTQGGPTERREKEGNMQACVPSPRVPGTQKANPQVGYSEGRLPGRTENCRSARRGTPCSKNRHAHQVGNLLRMHVA